MATDLIDPTLSRLTEQANRFARSGRFSAARAMLAAIRKQHDTSSAVNEIDARVCIGEGRFDDAWSVLDRAITATPGVAQLHLLRADVRARLNDFTGAARDASEAVFLRPDDPNAKTMLGLVLLELHLIDDALACLRESVRGAPRSAAPWRGLAEALRRAGDTAGAAAALDAAIENIPNNPGLRTAAITLALGERNFQRARELGATAQAEGVADACIFGLYGHALSHLGHHAAAGDIYQEALKLAPEDVYVRHLVSAAGLLPDSTRAPDSYLETVFDGYAPRFEEHLIGLGYRVPGLVRTALLGGHDSDAGTRPLGRVLDLGCGTGLIGVVLSDCSFAELTGVDLSAKMLGEADGKAIYTRLVHQEIGAFLAQDDGDWDTIIASDVLCYFGSIADILAAVRSRLRPGGLLIFSVEEVNAAHPVDDGGWRLASQGRFQHTQTYLADCLRDAGFTNTAIARETLRLEAGTPVLGFLTSAHRPVEHA